MIENFEISYPDLNTIEKFNKIVSPCFAKLENLEIQIQKLKESRDFLLPKLMNGTINVDKAC